MIQRFTLKKHSHDALVEHLHGVKSLGNYTYKEKKISKDIFELLSIEKLF